MAIGHESLVLVSTMRNEGPYIIEWLAHHFALGVDELVVFSNDCTDNTDHILDRLERLMPDRVKHQPNPRVMFRQQGRWHIMALRYAGLMGRVQEADWVYVTDADEFLNLKGGDGTLGGFFEQVPACDAVSFTSVPFNSNGLKEETSEPVTERFTQTAVDYQNAAAAGQSHFTAVKTLFRNTVKGARRPHRPVTPKFSETGMTWINGSGDVMGPEFTDGHEKGIDGRTSRQLAQVNHYSIKSAGEFLLKVDRGDAVMPERLGQSEKYWANANTVGITDTSGVGLSAKAQALRSEWLSDPKLKQLHEDSYALRAARLKEVLATPKGEELARKIGYFEHASANPQASQTA